MGGNTPIMTFHKPDERKFPIIDAMSIKIFADMKHVNWVYAIFKKKFPKIFHVIFGTSCNLNSYKILKANGHFKIQTLSLSQS